MNSDSANAAKREAPGKTGFESAMQETRRLVQSALSGMGSGSPASSGLGELTAYLAQSAGKGMRTRLLLSAAMDEKGLVPASAAKAAAALELLHMATLAHDDVIDGADTRRGRATLHKKFGNKSAILCGDYLLSLSLTMLAGMEMAKGETLEAHARLSARFAKALASICHGEYSQHVNVGNVDIALLTYLRVIGGKTAALFYIAAFMGALLGGETEEKALALGSFGRRLGMAFQIADDCKDYEQSEADAQKPVGNDLKNGVVTLPLILAMRKNPLLRKQALAAMKSEAGAAIALTQAQVLAQVLAQVREAQGPEMARNMARRFEKKAAKILAGLPARKREALLEILRSALRKDAQKTLQ